MAVLIQRTGNLLDISGGAAYEPLLSPNLTYTHKVSYRGAELIARKNFKTQEIAAGRPSGLNPYMDFFRIPLYQVNDSGAVICPAGLKNRVTETLDAHGVPWSFQDTRSRRFPPADFARLAEVTGGLDFRYKQDHVLAMIDSAEGGIIVAPTGYGKSHLAVLLAKVYPKSRIVLISPGLDLIKGLHRRFLENKIHDFGRVGGGHYEPEPRITLASADSLHKVWLDHADLIIYDEVHTAGTQEKLQQLSRFTEAKFIGLSASFPARADGADDAVESVFGPVLMRISYDDAVKHGAISAIRVLMLEVPDIPGYDNQKSDTAWKREAYWRNDFRNAVLAASLTDVVPNYLPLVDPQTLVMVETIDHAVHLRKYLPNYQIVYANLDDERIESYKRRKLWGVSEAPIDPKTRDKLRTDFESGTLKHAIATHVWNAGVNFVQLPLLVRADGGTSESKNIQIPGRMSRLHDGKEYGLLVDTIDLFDSRAEKRSKDRMRAYAKLGWDIQKVAASISPA